MNLKNFIHLLKKKIRNQIYVRFYSTILSWILNKFKYLFSLFFTNLNLLLEKLMKLFFEFFRLVGRMSRVSKKIESNLELNDSDIIKFQSSLKHNSKYGWFYNHNKVNDLNSNSLPVSSGVIQNTYYPMWGQDPEIYKKIRQGIPVEEDIDDYPSEEFIEEEEEEEEKIPFRPENSGPPIAALGTEIDNLKKELVHIEEVPSMYVPISFLHFYALSDDFLSSDIYNNFILDESLFRYFFFENDAEMEKFFHWPREVLATGQRAATTGFQTRPNVRFRRSGSRSPDRFKNSYRVAIKNGSFVFATYGSTLRSRDAMFIARRHKVLGKEPWFAVLPGYILGPEMEHSTYGPIVDDLVPFLAFSRDEYEQPIMLDLLYNLQKKNKFFRNFFVSSRMYEDFLDRFNYNWQSYWALKLLRFTRLYDQFLFLYLSFLNYIIDSLYINLYLMYVKPFFLKIPLFKRFFYTHIYFRIRSPVSDWLETQVDSYFQYDPRYRKRYISFSTLKSLHFLIKKPGTIFNKMKLFRKTEKRLTRVINKFNKAKVNNVNSWGLKVLKQIKKSKIYYVPRHFYENFLNRFWSKLDYFHLLESDFTKLYINFIGHNQGITSTVLTNPSKFDESSLLLNRNVLDFRAAYYRFLKLRQTQNYSLREIRSLVNFLQSERDIGFSRLLPIYHERRIMRNDLNSEVWIRDQDIDFEVLSDAARALYPGLDSHPLNEPIFNTMAEHFDMVNAQFYVGDLAEAYYYHRDGEEDFILDEFAKDQVDLDLLYVSKRATEDRFSDENSTLLTEMEHIIADDRYEYIAKSMRDQVPIVETKSNSEKLSITQKISRFFFGSRKTIDQIIEEEVSKQSFAVESVESQKGQQISRVYGKRSDYSLDNEFDKAQLWFDSNFVKQRQRDRKLLAGLVNMKLPTIAFKNYDLYTSVVNELETVPIQGIDTSFDESKSGSFLKSFILENADELYDNLDFNIDASVANREYYQNIDPMIGYDKDDLASNLEILEQIRKMVDFSFLYEWLRDKNIAMDFNMLIHEIKKEQDYKNAALEFGYIPRFWRDREFKTALKLDETRSTYTIFLQVFQALFFIFSCIFTWATIRNYVSKSNSQNPKMKGDKRVEFLIKVYWSILFSFIIFFIAIQYFTYDATWLKDCVSYHFYSFYIAVCDAKASFSNFTFPVADSYTQMPPNFKRLGGYTPYSSHTLFVFISYLSLYQYILFFTSIIVIFETVKRVYMKTVESYLIFLLLQFTMLNYLFFTTSVIEVFFIGKETLMLFTALIIFFLAFMLWFHGSGRRIKIRDQYIPYVIKLEVPDNTIVGNPDLIIASLISYYDHIKLILPVIVKDLVQIISAMFIQTFNYIRTKFRVFKLHRFNVKEKRRILSERMLKKRLSDLEKHNDQNRK